jgi:hypothetical protein
LVNNKAIKVKTGCCQIIKAKMPKDQKYIKGMKR